MILKPSSPATSRAFLGIFNATSLAPVLVPTAVLALDFVPELAATPLWIKEGRSAPRLAGTASIVIRWNSEFGISLASQLRAFELSEILLQPVINM
jgi:hypothetical protein